MFAAESPVKRWLQERIKVQLEDEKAEHPPMESIYQYCRNADELVRAFWLAALCRECVSVVAREMEEKTYGKVSRNELGTLRIVSNPRLKTIN